MGEEDSKEPLLTSAESVSASTETDDGLPQPDGLPNTVLGAIRQLLFVVYIPSVCFGLAGGVALPFIPLLARSLGCHGWLNCTARTHLSCLSHAKPTHPILTFSSFFFLTSSLLYFSVFILLFLYAYIHFSLSSPSQPLSPLLRRALFVAHVFFFTDATVGAVVAMKPLGKLFGDVPAGMLFTQLGCKKTMTLGLCGAAITALIASTATRGWQLGLAFLISGVCESLFTVSRSSYLRTVVQGKHRGRVTSLLGGVNRFTRVVGPAVGGVAAQYWGLSTPLVLRSVMLVVSALAVTVGMPPGLAVALKDKTATHNITGTLTKYWRIYATVGISVMLLNFVRSSRTILIPLKGHDMQLSHQRIGFCVSLGFFVDTALFAPAGWAMDTIGRKSVALPAFFIMSLGLICTGLWTHSELQLQAVTILMGLGNGLSAGLNMVLGADHAPPAPYTGEFLGVFQLFGDLGAFLGPIFVGSIAHRIDLDASAMINGSIGLAGFLWFALTVRETLKKGNGDQHVPVRTGLLAA